MSGFRRTRSSWKAAHPGHGHPAGRIAPWPKMDGWLLNARNRSSSAAGCSPASASASVHDDQNRDSATLGPFEQLSVIFAARVLSIVGAPACYGDAHEQGKQHNRNDDDEKYNHRLLNSGTARRYLVEIRR